MDNLIKTAILSYGMSGLVFHGPLLKVNKGFEVLQVWERSKHISKQHFSKAQIVKSYEAILNNQDVELIIVNTPDKFHFEMAKLALEAGKHIVVEKPVTQKSADAAELIELARKKGLVFSVFQNRRWDGDFLTVQKILKEKKLGRLIEFESHYDRYRTIITPDTWKEEADEYGGVLYNLGSHMIDQAYVLFGKPSAVTAHLKIVRKGGVVTDYYDIRMEYEEFSAILKCSYLVKDPGPRYSIYGEYGTFHKYGIDPQEELLKAGRLPIGSDWGTEAVEDWGTIIFEENGEDVEELVPTLPGSYNIFYNNVYDAIRNGKELFVQPEETLEVLKIMEACVESNREKRTIVISD